MDKMMMQKMAKGMEMVKNGMMMLDQCMAGSESPEEETIEDQSKEMPMESKEQMPMGGNEDKKAMVLALMKKKGM